MEKIIFKKSGIALILFLFSAGTMFSQTAGTLSFSVTTTSTGGYSPANLLAIWIENSSNAFIKTKISYAGPDDLDHLQTWVSKSGQNTVDATSGPTRTSHGTVTFLWNGTNISGSVVPDGPYLVWLEMAWASNFTTGKTVNSYPFTKGAAVFHSTPANTANFLSAILDWTPATTAVEGILENKDIRAFPNPTSGIFSIDFKRSVGNGVFELIANDGRVVHSEKIPGTTEGIRTFDLTGLTDGIYLCRLRFSTNELVFKVVLAR